MCCINNYDLNGSLEKVAKVQMVKYFNAILAPKNVDESIWMGKTLCRSYKHLLIIQGIKY